MEQIKNILDKQSEIMNYPASDGLGEALETFSEDAYIFCAPETFD